MAGANPAARAQGRADQGVPESTTKWIDKRALEVDNRRGRKGASTWGTD